MSRFGIELPKPNCFVGRRVRILGAADSILFQACQCYGSKHGWMTLGQICNFARLVAAASCPSVGRVSSTRRAVR